MGLLDFLKETKARIDAEVETRQHIVHGEHYVPSGNLTFSRALTLDEDVKSIYVMTEAMGTHVANLVATYCDPGRTWAIVEATLVPEPRNRYDPEAVLVVDGSPIGYLSHGAQNVAHGLLAKSRGKVRIVVGVANWYGGKAYYFSSKTSLQRWIRERVRIDAERAERARVNRFTANIRHAGEYQTQLAAIYAMPGHLTTCKLTVDEQPSGKYKGGPRITVWTREQGQIGVIDARYQAEDPDFFQAVLNGVRDGIVTVEEFEQFYGRCQLPVGE